MLAKLLKHNLKAIYKPLVIFYLIILGCAGLARLFMTINSNNLTFFLGEFFKGATTGFIIGAIINNGMNLWQYFRSIFYGDRSYLTHTLPIPRSTLYFSHFLTMLITVFSTLIISGCSLFIVYGNAELFHFISEFINYYGFATALFRYALPFLIVLYLEFVFIVQCGLLGIIIGHRAINNRLLLSVATGFIVFTISNFLTVALAMLLTCFNAEFRDALFSGNAPSIETISLFLYAGAAVYLIYLSATYFLSLRLLKRGINVD